ncbi:MAG: hypothetical protein AAGD07_02835 [Planctomycetota bacterium]
MTMRASALCDPVPVLLGIAISLAIANPTCAQTGRIVYPTGRVIVSPSTTQIQSSTPNQNATTRQSRVISERVISGPTVVTRPATTPPTTTQIVATPVSPTSAAQEPTSISDQTATRKPALDPDVLAMGMEVWQRMLELERENARLEAELDYERQLAKYRAEFDGKTMRLEMEVREREHAGNELREHVKVLEREIGNREREVMGEVRKVKEALEQSERRRRELEVRNNELIARLEASEKRAEDAQARLPRESGPRPGPPMILRDRMGVPARRGESPRQPPPVDQRNRPSSPSAKRPEHAGPQAGKDHHNKNVGDAVSGKPTGDKPSAKKGAGPEKPSDHRGEKRRRESRKPPIDLPTPYDLPPGISMPYPDDLPGAG